MRGMDKGPSKRIWKRNARLNKWRSIMEHKVFEWIIAVAVLVVSIANMIFLALIYRMLKPLIAKLQVTNDKINPILSEVQGIISDNRGKINTIVSESQPIVRNIVVKTNDIAAMVSDIISDTQPVVHDIGTRVNDITGGVRDIVLTVKGQIEQLDSIVRNVSGIIDETALIVESRVIEPVLTKANDITELVCTQMVEISAFVRDTALALKNQAERLDELVRCTTNKIDSTTTTLQKQVTESAREINYLGVAIKRVISTLFSRDSKT